MPNQYTGNPLATQSPSPAPSLGSNTEGDPIGNLIADGDGLNASAWLQDAKVALDWIAFFRRKLSPYKGIREWDAQIAYATGDVVWLASDGLLYLAAQSSTNQNPHLNTTYWTQAALTTAQVLSLVENQNWGVSISTSVDGITVSGGTLVTSSVMATRTGYSTFSRRVSFQVAMDADGAASITFSGDKVFTDSASAIRVVHATSAPGSTGSPGTMVWGYRHASTPNSIVVGIAGLGAQGGGINVSVEGY